MRRGHRAPSLPRSLFRENGQSCPRPGFRPRLSRCRVYMNRIQRPRTQSHIGRKLRGQKRLACLCFDMTPPPCAWRTNTRTPAFSAPSTVVVFHRRRSRFRGVAAVQAERHRTQSVLASPPSDSRTVVGHGIPRARENETTDLAVALFTVIAPRLARTAAHAFTETGPEFPLVIVDDAFAPSVVIARVFEKCRIDPLARDSIRRFDRSPVARQRSSRDVRTPTRPNGTTKSYTIVVRTRLTVCPHSYSHPDQTKDRGMYCFHLCPQKAFSRVATKAQTLENVGKSPNGRASHRSVVLERQRARGDDENVGRSFFASPTYGTPSRGDEAGDARGETSALLARRGMMTPWNRWNKRADESSRSASCRTTTR